MHIQGSLEILNMLLEHVKADDKTSKIDHK